MIDAHDLTDGGPPFGILRGAGRDDSMDVVAPYLEDPPGRGDFAVVPGADGALILRIARAFPTGSFEESSDRGADYLAQLARKPAEVPARVRELLLRFRVEVAPLGWLRFDSPSRPDSPPRFESGVRAIQLFGRPVWRPSRSLLEFLVNAGLQNEESNQVVRIGRLARGHQTVDDVPVHFSIRRLKRRRTFIFARAGYGKSNLTKLLLSRLYQAPPDVGLLIIDPEGEYAFAQRGERGQAIPGLIDHPNLRDRLLVFTDREIRAPAVVGKVRIDIARTSPGRFVEAFIPRENSDAVWVKYLRTATGTSWTQLVNAFRTRKYEVEDDELRDILRIGGGQSNLGSSLQALRNHVIPVLSSIDDPKSNLIDRSKEQLFGFGGTKPGVVVLDISTLPSNNADAIVRVLLLSLFQKSVEDFTAGTQQSRGVLLAIEEAQTIFGGRQLDDQDIYVRWVKEGRKYGLGAVLISQQPGAIAHELLSQGDNFFVMHLLSQRDLDVLGAANAHFTSEIRGFIRDEPVRGNCYFWSAPDQPYVVSVRVDNYEEHAVVAEPAPRPVTPTSSYEQRLTHALVRTLAIEPRVYLYAVASVDGEAVEDVVAAAPAYLAASIAEAGTLQELRPEEWREEGERAALRPAALDRALIEAEIAAEPLRCVGRVEKSERAMVLLRGGALRKAAAAIGVEIKKLREPPLELRARSEVTGR